QLQARLRLRRRNRSAEIARQLALNLCDAFPDTPLARAAGAVRPRGSGTGHFELGPTRGQDGIGTREDVGVLAAARRPAAAFHAIRSNGYGAGARRQQQTCAEHSILLAAFHDIARLDEDLLIADVLDLNLVDPTDLSHLDRSLAPRRAFSPSPPAT